ncbi:unnamed protein product [Amoebophrya sp. A25]|nr:unnamed protein product [Amoebophrya sp. A25]|eukprot:GSA25T00021531001.1
MSSVTKHIVIASLFVPFQGIELVGAQNADLQAMLDKHNIYRCMHNIPLLSWSADIAAKAQSWADNGAYQHSTQAFRTLGDGTRLGENLAIGSSMTGAKATKAWYDEIRYTEPYGTADSMTDTTDASQAIGHYTAMIWSDTTQIGCGKGTATFSGTTGNYYVCQYATAGNVAGQFSAKVTAPTKPVTQCGGTAADTPGYNDGLSRGTAGGFNPANLPSACTPSPPLPVGGLCVYGYQCASQFCCPYLKVCLRNPTQVINSNQITVEASVKASENLVNVIFRGGRTCKDPHANRGQCLQDSSGLPLATWDQSRCQCKSAYMTHYNAGTWVTLNNVAGLTCVKQSSGSTTSSSDSGLSGGAIFAIILSVFLVLSFAAYVVYFVVVTKKANQAVTFAAFWAQIRADAAKSKSCCQRDQQLGANIGNKV